MSDEHSNETEGLTESAKDLRDDINRRRAATLQHNEEEREYLEEELEKAGVIEPPDGGWGWAVVVGSFFANIIVDGIIFTAGAAFQPAWQEHFNAAQSETAWVVSLLSGCYLLTGPIVSALANMYGCKACTIAGTLLAAAGFGVSQFAHALPILYFTFGIMGGVGFGLVYLPSIVIVSYYFKKRRAFATGLAVCGSGIGTFVFAPLLQYLMREFTWQQTMLIISGIILHCIVCGMVYRKLVPSQKQVDDVAEIAIRYQERARIISESHSQQAINGRMAPQMSHLSEVEVIEEEPRSPHVTEGVAYERFSPNRRRSRADTEKLSLEHRPFVSVMELRARERQYSLFNIKDAGQMSSRPELSRIISQECVTQMNRPLAHMDIFYPGSISHLPERISRAPSVLMGGTVSGGPSMLQLPREGTDLTVYGNVIAILRTMVDLSLCRSPSFVILALGGFLTISGFFVPFVYLPRYAEAIPGISKDQASLLVSILGVTNIVARIFCGWLSDHPKVDCLIVHNVALTIAGVVTIFVPFMKTYWLLCGYCVLFGFGTACFASLRSVICVELLGLERLTSAFGFLLLFMGFAAIIGSPIAGGLRDLTGTYDLSFYVFGSLVAISGLIGFPLRFVNQWETKSYLEKEMDQNEDNHFDEENHFKHDSQNHSNNSINRSHQHIMMSPMIPVVEEEEEGLASSTNASSKGSRNVVNS